MKIYNQAELSTEQLTDLCQRPSIKFDEVVPRAQAIVDLVKAKGDAALIELAQQYDKVELKQLRVSIEEVKQAVERIDPALADAFRQAYQNIKQFHTAPVTARQVVQTMPGVKCFAEMRPIEKVGLYIPGGTAPLASTVLMLAIPAQLAGCREIVLCSPPRSDGTLDDSILFAADLCGVKNIHKAGGAQAIAAMAYGTETVPKVYKIFGPGNQYVTAAKMLIANDPEGAAIDMPAGPSEIMVVADAAARADFVASDLLSQAEHGPDSLAVLVCTSQTKALEIKAEVERQMQSLPRKEILETSIAASFVLIVESISEAIDFANQFAPEHLILNIEDPDSVIDSIINAGSVFLGPYSPESAGDYASGTNHSLPTYGYARAYSGVNLASFQKRLTFQKLSQAGARTIAPTVMAMATSEGLEAHRRAMEKRL